MNKSYILSIVMGIIPLTALPISESEFPRFACDERADVKGLINVVPDYKTNGLHFILERKSVVDTIRTGVTFVFFIDSIGNINRQGNIQYIRLSTPRQSIITHFMEDSLGKPYILRNPDQYFIDISNELSEQIIDWSLTFDEKTIRERGSHQWYSTPNRQIYSIPFIFNAVPCSK